MRAEQAGGRRRRPFDARLRARALALLTPEERRQAGLVTLLTVISAAVASAMVWSVAPFLRVLADPTALAAPGALGELHRLLGEPEPHRFLVALGAFSIFMVIAASALQLLHTLMLARFNALQVHSLSRRLLAAYLSRPFEFFLSRNTSDLSATMISEAETAVREFYQPALMFLSSLMTTAALVLLLCYVNLGAALGAALFIGGFYGLGYFAIRARLRRAGQRRSEANRARHQCAAESLQGIRDIRILGRERHYLDRFEAPSDAVREASVAVRVLAGAPRYLVQAVIFSAGVLFCLGLVSDAELRSGQAVAEVAPAAGVFALAGLRLMPELHQLFSTLATMQFGAAAIDRIHAELAAPAEPLPAPNGPRLRLADALELDGVSYRYSGASGAGVREIAVRIRASETIGIVGASGAGKSTLGNLLLGLFLPTGGELRVDGTRIDRATVRAWQRSVGFVAQEVYLADATVAENIALGVPAGQIDMTRVADCARMANIDATVAALPEGYATRIGERGVRFSGGQRQRVAIARALYRDADLLVFDEATSALDSGTESEVMAALRTLPGEKTIVIIAHRLSTLDACDRILVLDGGRIAGLGPRAALERDCPAYRRLMA